MDKDYSEYIQSESKRVRKLYVTKHKSGFVSRDDFMLWFIEKLRIQNYCCFYCETSIFDINKLIDTGKLATRKVRGGGKRGPVLEIDKQENSLGYAKGNCVLACYYCNNDKSYISEPKEYKEFFGKNRKNYFNFLMNG